MSRLTWFDRWAQWLFVCGLLALAELVHAAAPVKIGVLAYRPKAQVQTQWQALAAALKTAIPAHDFVVQVYNLTELETAVMNRQVDFVLTNPGHYVLLTRRAGVMAPLTTLINGESGHDLLAFGGVIFTRAGQNNIQSLADIKGKTVAAVGKDSLGGYQMQALELLHAGIDLQRDARLVAKGLPQDKVVQAVRSGEADVGFVRTGLLEAMAREGKLDLHQVKVLNAQALSSFPLVSSTALFPEWPLAYLSHVDEHLAREVTAVLFRLHENESLMRTMEIRGFAVPADYSPVADLLRELRMPPFDATPVFTWRDVAQRYRWPMLIGFFLLTLAFLQSTRLWFARRELLAEVAHRRASEQATAQSREILRRVIDNIPIRIFWKDRHSRYLGCNPGFAQDAGFANVDAVVGKDDAAMTWRASADELQSIDQLVMTSNQPKLGYEEQQPDSKGGVQWLRTSKVPLRDAQGDVFGVLGLYEDVTERRRTQDQLRLAASVFESAREGIFITDMLGNIVEVNHAFTVITGYSRAEVFGRNPRLLNSGRQDAAFYTTMFAELQRQGHWQGELWNQRKNGEIYAEMLTVTVVRDELGTASHYVALFFDITAIKMHQQQLEHIAHFDALTNLPNRVMLHDRLHQTMAQAVRRGQLLAVVYLDLDGFKQVNDAFGHDAGDRLLVAVSDQMKHALREGDTLARLGGDEFVAVLTDLNDVNDCASTLKRLLEAAGQPMVLGDAELKVSASLGVTFFPQADPVDADQLLRQADQAMYQAKLSGKNRYHTFDAAHDRSVRGLHERLDEVAKGIECDEFVLFYQPKVNLRSGVVFGVEALIRWQHPTKGLLQPGQFLPPIENQPLSVALGDWVIQTAVQQISQWHSAGLDVQVSVNVGARQLQQNDFVAKLAQVLAQNPSVAPSQLEIEVLETSALQDIERTAKVMQACTALGVGFALDDFGTGYSSLTYLKHLPVRTIKIDQSFVHDMLLDADDLAILEGVISLARAFRRSVIAEGMETIAQGTRLLQMGCEQAQGYGIARPMPPTDFPGWLQRWQPDPAWVAATSLP